MERNDREVLYLGPVLENGISQWDTMSSSLRREWATAAATIKELHDTAPWGDGPEGRAFARAYLMNDGPSRLVETGSELVEHIVDAGSRLRTTIATSRATDAAIESGLSRRPTVLDN
ncbi:hypothetical protein ACQEUU_06650 [Nonomuraea sp. CA-218870]|uniref:hypothetical protein n=1 Tax=Nonomuraea sp. CA-218870 TaxID=3239998 RepID=UPI003D9486E8